MTGESDSRALSGPVPFGGRAERAGALEQEVVGLFDQLRDPLFRYLLTFGLAGADCEEVIQEAFLALVQHLQRERSRRNLRGWLFRVAHNQALKRRQRHREESLAELESAEQMVADPRPDPEAEAASGQMHARLQAVLRALPEQDRHCLSLRAEGLGYREIAEVLEMSLGAVSISLGRSLARIARAAER